MKILKKFLPASNNIPCQFVDINASFSSFSVNDLLRFIERSKFFIHCVGGDEFIINSSIDNCVSNFIKVTSS